MICLKYREVYQNYLFLTYKMLYLEMLKCVIVVVFCVHFLFSRPYSKWGCNTTTPWLYKFSSLLYTQPVSHPNSWSPPKIIHSTHTSTMFWNCDGIILPTNPAPPFSVDTPLIKMSLKGCFLFFNLRRTQKAKFVTVVKMVYLRRVCN